MDRAVYKFLISASGGFGSVQMPVASEILHADVQRGQVYVWALCDPDAPLAARQLGYFGTGYREIPLTARHVGTCMERDFNLVWHVFEDFLITERTEVPA